LNDVFADNTMRAAKLYRSGGERGQRTVDGQLPMVSTRTLAPPPRPTARIQPKAAHHPASRSVGGTSPFTALRSHTGQGGGQRTAATTPRGQHKEAARRGQLLAPTKGRRKKAAKNIVSS
jgi:hypothetical protein